MCFGHWLGDRREPPVGVLIRSYIGICGSVRVDHESPEALREEERRWESQVLHGSLEDFLRDSRRHVGIYWDGYGDCWEMCVERYRRLQFDRPFFDPPNDLELSPSSCFLHLFPNSACAPNVRLFPVCYRIGGF